MVHEDGEVVARVLGGDVEAYVLLFRKYARVVHAIALARTTRLEAAAGITRRTFEKVYAGLESLPGDRPLRQVLVDTAVELSREHVRDHGRSLQMFRISPEEAKKQSGTVDLRANLGKMHPDDAALVVLELVGRLPPQYEAPLLLRLVEGMRYGDIGALTGKTAVEVRTTLDGARRLFEREFRFGMERAE